jgi:hypothetical protein
MTAIARKLAAASLAVALSTRALAAEVDRREASQQARIAQGIRTGQLTPGETARLERKAAAIRREIHADRAANGGHLTPAERAQVNRQQDHLSRQIHAAKHDGRTM